MILVMKTCDYENLDNVMAVFAVFKAHNWITYLNQFMPTTTPKQDISKQCRS